jgi:hypothetical protein
MPAEGHYERKQNFAGIEWPRALEKSLWIGTGGRVYTWSTVKPKSVLIGQTVAHCGSAEIIHGGIYKQVVVNRLF